MTESEVRNLLALCEAADDQDTGSLDAFREAASVGVVADLCETVLAQTGVIAGLHELNARVPRDRDGRPIIGLRQHLPDERGAIILSNWVEPWIADAAALAAAT